MAQQRTTTLTDPGGEVLFEGDADEAARRALSAGYKPAEATPAGPGAIEAPALPDLRIPLPSSAPALVHAGLAIAGRAGLGMDRGDRITPAMQLMVAIGYLALAHELTRADVVGGSVPVIELIGKARDGSVDELLRDRAFKLGQYLVGEPTEQFLASFLLGGGEDPELLTFPLDGVVDVSGEVAHADTVDRVAPHGETA